MVTGRSSQVQDAVEFAYPISMVEAAQRLRSLRHDTPVTAVVTVVGAGPTGIETAVELAEQGAPSRWSAGGVLGPYLPPQVRHTARKYLANREGPTKH